MTDPTTEVCNPFAGSAALGSTCRCSSGIGTEVSQKFLAFQSTSIVVNVFFSAWPKVREKVGSKYVLQKRNVRCQDFEVVVFIKLDN